MALSSPSKTLARGLSKTRSGSPSISLQSLIDRSKQAGFSDRIKKAVSEEEAIEAARRLSENRKNRVRRYVESGTIGGAAYPIISAAGEAAGALAGRGPGRFAAAGRAAAKVMNRTDLAKNVTRGMLGGGGVQAMREGVELGKAKKTVSSFIDDRKRQLGMHTPQPSSTVAHGENVVKAAGVEPAPQSRKIPQRRPNEPWKYDPRPAEEF